MNRVHFVSLGAVANLVFDTLGLIICWRHSQCQAVKNFKQSRLHPTSRVLVCGAKFDCSVLGVY